MGVKAVAAFAALALSGPSAQAACATLPSGFVPTPTADLLTKYPTGGPLLASEVRNIVAADPAQLGTVTGLARTASAGQRQAIGTGLGQAAALCVRTEEASARAIQQGVVTLGDDQVLTTFRNVTGDQRTASTGSGGGAGGAGGAGGSGGGSGGGTSTSGLASSGSGSPYFVPSAGVTTNLAGVIGSGTAGSVLASGTLTGSSLGTALFVTASGAVSPNSP